MNIGLEALSVSFTETLRAIYYEWSTCHLRGMKHTHHSTFDGFVQNVNCTISNIKGGFIHPEWVEDERLFGNHWTI